MSEPDPATLWIADQPLVLASTSRTRRNLLEAAGIAVETRQPGVDERAIEEPFSSSGAPIEDLASLLAREKALAVSRREPGRLVLGADQTLECDGRQFHKPVDIAAARNQLAALSGKTHHLHSAAALARDGEVVFEVVSTADLDVRPLEEAFVTRYVEVVGDSVLSSVGGYQVEGAGVQLFSRINGDHFTILGLPLLPVLAFLREEGCLAS
ncbi:septum formation protein [Pseudochelatococcus lubricantis]|uniref:Nucleoside triphosphate pyrophosphatase n=1 Tax=Pseudochelatococcus lubricantis TaxID=1538102 RepID=A0ABX0V3K5_9HYPH|nr:Maf family protein [Pseudochelatococcus lubricantis]NIJ58390.1 septum formation protein [Pseudochelatococcus lubricantis]